MFHRQAFKSLENVPYNQDSPEYNATKSFCQDNNQIVEASNQLEQEFLKLISLGGDKI
jgi:hypothetical protein